MRALAFTFVFMASAAQAAEPITLHCQRYQSRCVGDKCYAVADSLREDTKKEILTLQTMEKARYTIQDGRATADLEEAITKTTFTPEFEHVTVSDTSIILEEKSNTGVIKQRITIERPRGFYSKYLFHTDGSIKDVKIGDPYTALFGWCEETSPTPSTAPTTAQ